MPQENDSVTQYPMCLAWHTEIKCLAYESKLPAFEQEHGLELRHLVEDIYHNFRANGGTHEEAIADILVTLPHMHRLADGEWEYKFEKQKSRLPE